MGERGERVRWSSGVRILAVVVTPARKVREGLIEELSFG